jgi:molybdopterin/thiamine biosynthesis adenylyltransferase
VVVSMMYFERLRDVRDADRMTAARVLLIGVGRTGSRVGWHLARNGAVEIAILDHDIFEAENMPGHVLPASFVGQLKAPALASWLSLEMPWTRPRGVVHKVRASASYPTLVPLIEWATIVIVATDDPAAQYTAGRVCVALDKPALYPGLYERGGGEVFLTLGLDLPCYECWSRFRPPNARLRAVAAASQDSLAVEQATVHLALGLIDRSSPYASVMVGSRRSRAPRQLYTLDNFGGTNQTLTRDHTWGRAIAQRRAGCPGCTAARRLRRGLRPSSTVPAPARAPDTTASTSSRLATPASRLGRTTTRRRRKTMRVILVVEVVLLVLLVCARFLAPDGWPLYHAPDAVTASIGRHAGTKAATVAVVHLAPHRIGPTTSVSQLVVGETGRIFVRAPRAQTPSLRATVGIVEPPRPRGDGWWEWLYHAPSTPGGVRLTLEAVFPGPSYDADVTHLTFVVVLQQS